MKKKSMTRPNIRQVEFIKNNLYIPNREILAAINQMGDEFTIELVCKYKNQLRPSYDQATIDKAMQLYRSGTLATELSQVLNIPFKDVLSIIRKHARTSEEIQVIVDFCKANYPKLSAPEIAQELSIPLTTVAGILKKNKLYHKRKKLSDKQIDYVLESIKKGKSIKSLQNELGVNLYYRLSKFNLYQKIKPNKPNKQVI